MTRDETPGQSFQCLHHHGDWVPAAPAQHRPGRGGHGCRELQSLMVWLPGERGCRPNPARRGGCTGAGAAAQSCWTLGRGRSPRGAGDGASQPLGCGEDMPGQQQSPRGRPCPSAEQGACGHRLALIESALTGGLWLHARGRWRRGPNSPSACTPCCAQLRHQGHLPWVHLAGSNSPKKHLFGQQSHLPALSPHTGPSHPLSCPEPPWRPLTHGPVRAVSLWHLIAVTDFCCWKTALFAGREVSLLRVNPDRLSTVVKRAGIQEKELKQPQSEGPVIYLLPSMNAGCKSLCIKITPFSNFWSLIFLYFPGENVNLWTYY